MAEGEGLSGILASSQWTAPSAIRQLKFNCQYFVSTDHLHLIHTDDDDDDDKKGEKMTSKSSKNF
jgi:hypothetical protein